MSLLSKLKLEVVYLLAELILLGSLQILNGLVGTHELILNKVSLFRK